MMVVLNITDPNVGSRPDVSVWSGAAVCPNCRTTFSVSAAPLPCCPALRALLSPPPLPRFVNRVVSASPAQHIHRIKSTIKMLKLSGWYRHNLDWKCARAILSDCSVGSFIVRDSGNSQFIFSLSVKTARGPNSIRIHYNSGLFQLDARKRFYSYMPKFKCVVELIQYYVNMDSDEAMDGMWVDSKGHPHAAALLRAGHRSQPPTLMHAARLAVHRALAADRISPRLSTAPTYERLPLPKSLIDYLAEYPYSC